MKIKIFETEYEVLENKPVYIGNIELELGRDKVWYVDVDGECHDFDTIEETKEFIEEQVYLSYKDHENIMLTIEKIKGFKEYLTIKEII
jgi:hypothetical protein